MGTPFTTVPLHPQASWASGDQIPMNDDSAAGAAKRVHTTVGQLDARYHPNAGLAASYSNTGGQGDRTALIRVTSTDGIWHAGSTGPLANLVDGATGNNPSESVYFNNGQSATGLFIQFDFGRFAAKVITEATWRQSSTSAHGSWKWQGSTDGSTWTDIGSSFTLGGATVQTHTELASNTTGYRYYRLLGVSGTTSGNPWLQEVEFKLTGAATDGLAAGADTAQFPTDFPSSCIAADLFDRESGDVVRDEVGSYDIDLTTPTNPNVTKHAWGLRTTAGLIETPQLLGLKSMVLVFRQPKGNESGFLISGGNVSGNGVIGSIPGQDVNLNPKYLGSGLSWHDLDENTSTGDGSYELNRGYWGGFYQEFDQSYDTIIGLGGRHSTTTFRISEADFHAAFFFNANLTATELAVVERVIRRRLGAHGVTLHNDDATDRRDLIVLLGESNGVGRSTLTDLSAADHAANLTRTLIVAQAGGGDGDHHLDLFELGLNQQNANPATEIGPETGVALRNREQASERGPAVIISAAQGSTFAAPNQSGIATGVSWNASEEPNTGRYYLARRQIHHALQELNTRGIGASETIRVGLWIGLNDATNTAYAPSSAAYQGYLQALWDRLKADFAGHTLALTVFRAHNSDPGSNATALMAVRAGTDAFGTANSDVTVVDTDGYGLETGNVHYNAAGSRAMGVTLYG